MRTAGAWERGGTNLSVRRPGITCPDVLDQRDARPQPLRGRQRLWWPTVLIVGSDFLQTRRRTLSFPLVLSGSLFLALEKKTGPPALGPWLVP